MTNADPADPARIRRRRLSDLECDIARLERELGNLRAVVSPLSRRLSELEIAVYRDELPSQTPVKTIHLQRVFCGDFNCQLCRADGLTPPVGGPAPSSTR